MPANLKQHINKVTSLAFPWIPFGFVWWLCRTLPVEVDIWPPFFSFLPMGFFFVGAVLFNQALQLQSVEARLRALEGAKPE
jgi:hypothetical protein